MIFEFAGIRINIEFYHSVESKKPCLFFLHGFTGSSNDWKNIVPHINQDFSSAAIDLIGHGKSSSPVDKELYTADIIVNQIYNITTSIIKRKLIPVGYSMGGRAALSFAAKHPELIEGLILESSTPGIENEKLRNERITRDEEIALYIESHTMEDFAEYWMDLEIFNTQRRFSEEKRKQLRQTRINNDPTGLANSLRGFGTGTMPHLFPYLRNINCKTLLITGELDSKFTAINKDAVKQFKNAEHKIIKNAGHNTHAEEPFKFTQVINDFLKKF